MRIALCVLLCSTLASAREPDRKRAGGVAPPPDPAAELARGEAAFRDCQRYPEGKRFHWAVRGEVGLMDLVASLADISCKTILVGPNLAQRAGKVSIQAPDLVSAPEVYRLFHAALETMGLAISTTDGRLKIVDAGHGREVTHLLDGDNEATPGGEQFVTRLLRIEHASAQEVSEVVGRLKSHDGEVTVYAAGPSLILTDRAENVRRMETLARALDVAQPGDRLWVIASHGQSPGELAATIDKVTQATRKNDPRPDGKGAARSPDAVTAVVPVDSARLLLVVAGEAGYRRVAQLCARIDPPDLDGTGASQAHVIYLAHTNAEDMAATLRDLGISRGGARPGTAAPGASPLTGEVRLSADKVSNAIVVFAGPGDFSTVRDLIARLDLPRRQVYIEAAILDLSIDRSRNIGVAWHGGTDVSGQGTAFAGSSSPGLSSVITDAKSLAGLVGAGGLTTGILGNGFQVAGVTIPSFGVVLQALEHSKDVNVLSRPHLLTMDNTKATLSVGQSIPFPTSSLGAQLSSAVPSVLSSYRREDVALKIDLTPHLNDSDSIRLELDGEISDVPDGQSGSLAGGPITNKRTIKTSVVVGDGETVVLGGLQKESESETVEKVPGLGDLPLLGALFRYKSKQRTKQDLLIVLTPWVIRGPDDLRRIYQRRESERREFIERATAFTEAYVRPVDWRRKRGLLEEIRVATVDAEREGVALAEAKRELRPAVVEGPVE